MREIKFRAWHPEKKKTFYDVGILADDILIWEDMKLDWILIGHISSGRVMPQLNLMQYTGLMDKNGKEIYEGNRVKMIKVLYGDTSKEERCEPFIAEVFWRDGKFLYCEITDEETAYPESGCLYAQTQELEVIGNIYENKELLAKEKV